MKTKIITFVLVSFAAVLLQGCVAFPPLIQVEHKGDNCNNKEVLQRLDAINHRLDQLEQKVDKK